MTRRLTLRDRVIAGTVGISVAGISYLPIKEEYLNQSDLLTSIVSLAFGVGIGYAVKKSLETEDENLQ